MEWNGMEWNGMEWNRPDQHRRIELRAIPWQEERLCGISWEKSSKYWYNSGVVQHDHHPLAANNAIAISLRRDSNVCASEAFSHMERTNLPLIKLTAPKQPPTCWVGVWSNIGSLTSVAPTSGTGCRCWKRHSSRSTVQRPGIALPDGAVFKGCNLHRSD